MFCISGGNRIESCNYLVYIETELLMDFKHIFGPVNSRRLGLSLGVDLVPHKTCSFDCIYCECGKTTSLTCERREYVPTDEVIRELELFLTPLPKLDFITFSGSGEPTLHSGIGKITDYIKKAFPRYRVALLTNSLLFTREDLWKEVLLMDVIIPSLDAVSEDVFKKINRPCRAASVTEIVEGLKIFRKIYTGQIWLEIFIVPGVNDTPQEISLFRAAVRDIKPDKVQLNTLDRPGSEKWVKPASRDALEKIRQELGWPAEIAGDATVQSKGETSTKELILNMLSRRPCTVEDLSAVTGFDIKDTQAYIAELLKERRLKVETLDRGTFYQVID
jgi:wyosine [tRNA(Phe)-imidazoG37] synthetase (radical SAM superfamily)